MIYVALESLMFSFVRCLGLTGWSLVKLTASCFHKIFNCRNPFISKQIGALPLRCRMYLRHRNALGRFLSATLTPLFSRPSKHGPWMDRVYWRVSIFETKTLNLVNTGFFAPTLMIVGWRTNPPRHSSHLFMSLFALLAEESLVHLPQRFRCMSAASYLNHLSPESRKFIPNSHAMGSITSNRRTGPVGSPSDLVGGWCPGHVVLVSRSCHVVTVSGSGCDGVPATFWWCSGHVVMVSRSCCDGVPGSGSDGVRIMLWWCPGHAVVVCCKEWTRRFPPIGMTLTRALTKRSASSCFQILLFVPLYILLLGSPAGLICNYDQSGVWFHLLPLHSILKGLASQRL